MPWKSNIIADVPVATVTVRDGGTRDLTLDLYVPTRGEDHPAGSGAPPLLVYIHGGGWEGGHNDRPPAYRSILERGLALASLQYRFSHQGSGEDMVTDLVAGIRVAHRTAGEHGCDIERWFTWGVSAGGHLSSLAAHRLMAERPASDVPPPHAAACWCGVFDLQHYATLEGVREGLRADVTRIVTALTGGDPETARALSPVAHVSRQSVPHVFVHGAEDHLVPPEQSRLMHRALSAAGVRSELIEVPGRDHAMPPEDSDDIQRTIDFLLSC